MSEELQVLVDFAEGRLAGREFEAALYANPHFEQVLDDDRHLEPGTYVGASAYLFVLRCNFGLPRGVRSAHGAVVQFLERNGHDIAPANEDTNRHDLLMSAQPRWLDVPEEYFVEHVLPPLSHLQHGDLLAALKGDLRHRFRYNRKPPDWLQSPAWPINDNGPLVFIGQMATSLRRYDEMVFIFQDRTTGQIQTVLQST